MQVRHHAGFAVILLALLAARTGDARGEVADRDWLPRAQRGLAEREYRAGENGSGLQAPNRAHNLRTYFAAAGIRVHDRSAAGSPELLALSLARVGRGNALAPVAPGEIASDGARVEIRRPGLVEWYLNSPAGLEQGFTISERPAGEGALVLELAAELAQATLAGERVLFATPTGRQLAYGSLVARDAAGAELPARLEVAAADRLRIVVDDAGASYPLVIDPLLTETADTLLESNQPNALLGISVASAGDVNGDGFADVIVGDHSFDAGETDEGAAFIFLGSASGIANSSPATAAAQLESNQASSLFGFSVASAGDVNGDRYSDVIVSAGLYDSGESDEGAAFVFLGSATGIANASASTAATRLETNQASAALASAASAGDVNGDGYADVIVAAYNYDAGETDEGAAFVFLGSASGVANGSPSTAAAQLESDQASATFGLSVASAGDVNGDGYADVIAGAPNYDNGQSNEGSAFVFLGSATGIANGSPASAAAHLESDQASAELGRGVASAGDVNGDGYTDVIVGTGGYSAGQSGEGAAFVFLGSASGIADGGPTDAAAQLEMDQANAGFGNGIGVASAGDVNGDGYADVIVGAQAYDAGETDEGAVFLFLGSGSGIADGSPATAAAQLESNQLGGQLGYSVASAGDVNGDGYADVIAGAPTYDAGESNEGAAFVYLGGAERILGASAVISGDAPAGELGFSVSSAGDVNGDGFSDVIIGARNYDAGSGAGEGAAFVFQGSASGIATALPAFADTRLESDQASAFFGQSVASAGDVNADGYGDVIVGAHSYDAGLGQGTEAGSVFVFLGSATGIPDGNPTTAATHLDSNQSEAQLGHSVASAGDVNGDGYGDVIVGSRFYDNPTADEGAAFVFLGSASGIASGGPASAATRLESDQANAFLGQSVASAGDVNGDGYGDVIVGAHAYDAGQGNDEGAAFVFLGSPGGIPDGNPASPNVAQLESDEANAQLGFAVASAGDVNGDGFSDVIAGAYLYDEGGPDTDEGAAFVFLGSATGVADGNPATAASRLESNQGFANLGLGVASAGDVNGDGYADVIAAAPFWDGLPETDEGAAFVFLGSATGIAPIGNPTNAFVRIESGMSNALLGYSVAPAGDVNGDGYGDVIAGAHQYGIGVEGRAVVHSGNGDGDGRLVLARQLPGGASTALVQPWGLALSEPATQFRVRMQATHPEGRGRVRLQVQACAPGLAFGHPSCIIRTGTTWTDVTASSSGVTLTETLSGLTSSTLYRWRARVLHAPFSSAAHPSFTGHGPWRRLQGQALEGDLRLPLDTDGDEIANVFDPDDDNDGLTDDGEATAGTNPLDADSDDDGLSDGTEVLVTVTDPLDPDHDDDGDLDGSDNCPAVANGSQTNSDALAAGDACQCGDVNNDNVVNATDVQIIRERVVDRTPLSGSFVLARCDVAPGGVCDLADLAVLRRYLAAAPVTVANSCDAYVGP